MFALRHHEPAPAPEPHAWQTAPRCDEFRATGLELQLIDAVDELERAERVGSPDRAELAARVRSLHDEMVALVA